jgi:hypothetical protein
MMKKKRSRERQQWDAILNRVGWEPRERLAWAVRRVQQESRREMSPGEREDLRAEVAVFSSGVKGGGASWTRGELNRPAAEEINGILVQLGRILQAAVNRERVTVARGVRELSLTWGPRGRFLLWDDGDDRDWNLRARQVLARLLVDSGHLLKECRAPAWRGKPGETCETWFVANRPKQDYCSATCQRRAARRAFRSRQDRRT